MHVAAQPQRRVPFPQRQDRPDDDDRGRRQDALGPAGVEPQERQPVFAVELVHQLPRDQEAGDDEEDVDPDVATGEAEPEVAEHHQSHGDRPQAFDVRPEAANAAGNVAPGGRRRDGPRDQVDRGGHVAIPSLGAGPVPDGGLPGSRVLNHVQNTSNTSRIAVTTQITAIRDGDHSPPLLAT